ncbi:acetyltransferase (GNAT) family domain-containing protein [Purpureocillium lilacinum]|uniref:Acetyltransferase (GNAT) family domain-containing protein n=1 Tax=Purpureocillium lilacinum TaxID=33203 RepID=A0A179GGN4_PURLI|nr:acetyltransferase (GNAT) family domain-containing protein [Purpureocillium lilacinum]OAQ76523.1 acetyltransferase (GNAT) family domain-containing protein [Purpureocillium lilacinum]OAQ78060.1 acetyltransferase (GNAT) family domain-containing protein [Purpureocillium lilacinum]GJN79822.1 hypothetical protein PLIIFM63780_003342 [Purpureocillium lilacinum]
MSPATVDDAPALAAILIADFLDPDPWTRLCYGGIDPAARLAHLTAGLREDLASPEFPLAVQTMRDADTGEIVAFAQLNDENVPPIENRAPVEPITKPSGYNVPPIRDYFAKMSAAKKRAMGDAPYLHLVDVATKKAYRRRGIGSALMQWAMAEASRRQLPIYAEASPDGQAFYKHLGWGVLETWSVDMGQYGGKGIYTEEGMTWPPKSRT